MILMRSFCFLFAISSFACKSGSGKDNRVESDTSIQNELPENTNYATHPSNDLEVKSFLENFHQKNKSEAMLVDLRTPPEFDDGYIPGAILINFLETDFEKQLTLLDKNKTYFIYCQQGARSSKCLDKMKAMGFTRVYNLIGGYEEYLRFALK